MGGGGGLCVCVCVCVWRFIPQRYACYQQAPGSPAIATTGRNFMGEAHAPLAGAARSSSAACTAAWYCAYLVPSFSKVSYVCDSRLSCSGCSGACVDGHEIRGSAVSISVARHK